MGKNDARKPRDYRLDVARGLALCFIMFAHIFGTVVSEVIPARFGPSDAADMFVFVSGYAAAIAFGGSFVKFGFLHGIGRVAFRCAQLYGAQIGVFLIIALVAAVAARSFDDPSYIETANLRLLFEDPGAALVGVASLSYVPWFLNILPMYIAVLAMIPVAMLLARVHPHAVTGVSVILWVAAYWFQWNPPGDPMKGTGWGFNPLSWQLYFFLGFAISIGWLKIRLRDPVAMVIASVILVAGFVVSDRGFAMWIEPVAEAKAWLTDNANKAYLDPIRLSHFLASAYVVISLLKGHERVLEHRAFRPFLRLGQQALPTFLAGLVISQVATLVFAWNGVDLAMQIVVNGVCIALLFLNAAMVRYFKNPPWKPKPVPATPAAAPVAAPATPLQPVASPAPIAHHTRTRLEAGD
jgi:hypothetical protein